MREEKKKVKRKMKEKRKKKENEMGASMSEGIWWIKKRNGRKEGKKTGDK